MKRIHLITALVLCLASAAKAQVMEVRIVPEPSLVRYDRGSFIFKESTVINISDENLSLSVGIFASQVEAILGFSPVIDRGKTTKNSLALSVNEAYAMEAYTLDIMSHGISVVGGSPQGVFHGLQSLRQILISCRGAKSTRLPALHIEDKPFFGYRGMMLDVCRHFRTVDDVKVFLDILSMHKINVFHWHLTDDQGWRIAIDKYPRLSKIGSERAETVIGHAARSKEYDGVPYGKGMYYTKEQVREVIRYAADRHIEVIPEIEMPGHALAALAAYPELGCRGMGYKVSPTWGIFDDVYCAGKDGTFDLLEDVLAEVIELFPSQYIHIGGDECPKARWKECPLCQKRIAENGLADEDELQSYFMKRIEKFVNSRGKSIIGWEEILEGGISPTVTLMAWKRPEARIEAAQKGNRVIYVPKQHAYLDYYQSADTANEPFSIGGYVPVSKVYEIDPYVGLANREKGTVRGVQANLWTEYIKTMDHVEYMVLPRLAAIGEASWSYDRKDYDGFVRRMESLRKLYELNGYRYATHIFTNN